MARCRMAFEPYFSQSFKNLVEPQKNIAPGEAGPIAAEVQFRPDVPIGEEQLLEIESRRNRAAADSWHARSTAE